MSDNYDNPRTIKMFEVTSVEEIGKKLLKVVTYLRTSLIGHQKVVEESEITDMIKKCKAHGHAQGTILEVGRFV